MADNEIGGERRVIDGAWVGEAVGLKKG